MNPHTINNPSLVYKFNRFIYNFYMTVSSPINKLWKLLVLIILEGVVFQLVLWNINRFIAVDVTTFVTISNAILIFFILVASVTVIIFGNVIRSRVYSNLGFAIFLYAIVLFIFIYEGVDVKISAFATLVLAFAAFMAIDENRRLRRENRERENRDRKERKLNRIIDWATQILECNRDLPFVQAGFRTPLVVSITGYQANFNILSWRGVHIGFVAKSISRNVNDAVEHERKLLRQHKRIMDLEEEGKLRKGTAVGTHRKRIDESARTIIELAVKLL